MLSLIACFASVPEGGPQAVMSIQGRGTRRKPGVHFLPFLWVAVSSPKVTDTVSPPLPYKGLIEAVIMVLARR